MSKRTDKVGRFETTILFCDIRGFTALFDQREPEDALLFANSVLGELGSVVEACNGTIDKFTGDGFLAHFGIMNVDSRHAEQACWCAIRMRSALMKINGQRYLSEQPIVSLGIGIHTGTVAAGRIQTLEKSEFTIFGSDVNLAARIEGLTKNFFVDCLISAETAASVGDLFLLQEMPEVQLKGVSKKITPRWLLPMNIWNES